MSKPPTCACGHHKLSHMVAGKNHPWPCLRCDCQKYEPAEDAEERKRDGASES